MSFSLERLLSVMNEKRKKAHPLRTILFVLLAILILVFVSPFIYNLIGGFDDYDDVPALTGAGGVKTLCVEEDGIVSFSADKAAVYSYVSEAELKSRILERISQLPVCSERTVDISSFGYELDAEALHASAKLKLFGFVPVQLHADAELKLSPDTVQIRLQELKYGKWISIPLDKCAELFGTPELTDGITVNTSGFYGALYPVEITAKDSVISFRCDVLNKTAQQVGDSGVLIATLLPIVCAEDPDAAKVLRGQTADVCGKIGDPAALSELLTELLKFGSEADTEEYKLKLENSPFLDLKIGDISVCASGYCAEVSEALSGYESRLVSLRDNYKALEYSLAEDGLYSADGLRAEAALPEDWGARVVLQYNRYNGDVDAGAIVNINDGTLSGGEWVVLPNPKITDLERDSNDSLPNVPGIKVFDLTVALRTADGTPAILFLTAYDELGLNVISEKLYEQIVSSESLPVYWSSELISPTKYPFVTPEPAQRDLVCYLP